MNTLMNTSMRIRVVQVCVAYLSLVAALVAAGSSLQHLRTQQEVNEFVTNSAQVTALYFQQLNNAGNMQEFFHKLMKASDTLTKYDIQIATVDCDSDSNVKICKDLKDPQGEVRAFRNGVEKIQLPPVKSLTKSAIISTILHLKLIRSVPMLQSIAERHQLEDQHKGQHDIVLVYLKRLLTPGHAFALQLSEEFKDHKIAITTDVSVLKGLQKDDMVKEDDDGDDHDGADDDEGEREVNMWILRCNTTSTTDVNARCDDIPYRGHMKADTFRTFLTRIDQPLFTELKWSEDSNKLLADGSEEHKILQDMVLIVFDHQSKAKVTKTATYVAKRLLGELEVFTLNKDNIPDKVFELLKLKRTLILPPSIIFYDYKSNAAILNEFDSYTAYDFIHQRYHEQLVHSLSDADKEDFNNDGICNFQLDLDGPLEQDDMLAAKVTSMDEPNLDKVTLLDENNVQEHLQSAHVALVLYHVKWDHVSKAAVHVIADVAEQLSQIYEGDLSTTPKVTMIDCFDWNEVCDKHQVFTYPTIKIVGQEFSGQMYTGAIDKDNIISTLMLNTMKTGQILQDMVEVERFIEGRLHEHQLEAVNSFFLAVLKDPKDEKIFEEVSEELRGKAMIAATNNEQLTLTLNKEHTAEAPFILVSRPEDKYAPISILKFSSNKEQLVRTIINNNRYVLEELRANNYQNYHLDNTSLAILFVDEDKGEMEMQVVGKLAAELTNFNFVWISRTSRIGAKTLKIHGLQEQQGSLITVLSRKESSLYVYDGKITESKLKNWLLHLSNSAVITKKLLKKEWKPRVAPYDYLKMMEEESQAQDGTVGKDKKNLFKAVPADVQGEEPITPSVARTTIKSMDHKHTEL